MLAALIRAKRDPRHKCTCQPVSEDPPVGPAIHRFVRGVTFADGLSPPESEDPQLLMGTVMGIRSQAFALVAASLAVNVPAAADLAVVFSKDEVAIIHDYYAQHHDDVGKGQQKKQKSKPLPAGIAKNLTRGKSLPPGIAKQQLPNELIQRLPPVRAGYERVIVDGRLLLVAVATQVIVDVLSDAIFN